MCRYAYPYKPHYACFSCRKTFKRRLLRDVDRDSSLDSSKPYKCPDCGGNMADMGLDFESPKKSDIKAWEHIKNLYESGITFHSCGCTGPGYIPKDKEHLICFLNDKKSIYIRHKRFWLNRVEPETKSERDKDQQQHSEYFYRIPKKFNIGTRKKLLIDQEKAILYWTDLIEEIDKRINTLLKVT